MQFTSLDQSAKRGDFDIGLSGIEDIPARRQSLAASIPYYEFREVLTVREGDRGRYRSLADLKGRRVATLGGTIAYDLLLEAERTDGITAVSYDDDVHPYSDLLLGRVDAVVLDNVLAERAMRRNAGLFTHPEALAVGHYIVITAPENTALRDQVDQILRDAMRDGTLERIFRKWNVWNDDQPRLYERTLSRDSRREGSQAAVASTSELVARYVPSLFRAALITLVLSFAAMALAVALGVLIATGRVYGDPVSRLLLTVYVEVMRGTPVLLQLFVIYYGLASVIRLPAFIAALLGLGLNYAAYESEIYRSALEAVPRGQLDAARILGFSRMQTLRLVRAPQAFRLALAPMTNDFVALLKDSSLVSMLTVVELTKQTQIFATNIGSWVIPGTAVRAPVSGDVAAARLPRAPSRRAMEDADVSEAPALMVRGLHLKRGSREILRGVDLHADAGEVVALMGLSGSGKTTILRVIAGLEPRDAGEVSAAKVGMVFQFHFLFEHLCAIDNVTLAPIEVLRIPRGDARQRAQQLLDQLGVGHRAHALPRELSGGEAQRVAIARALAVDPPLLLLDEPTASLDPARRNDLGEALLELAKSGRALVMTSHDDDFVREFATRVVVLANGEVVEQGDPETVLTSPATSGDQGIAAARASAPRCTIGSSGR